MTTEPNTPETRCPVCGATHYVDGLCAACLLRQAALDTQDTDSATAAPVSTESPTQESVVAAFPQLEILELIGRGGMGTVFKARQPKLNRFVALKILSPEFSSKEHFAERFLREAQLLARLSHPNIVTVHDFGQSGGFYYLMMEFVDGVNLRQAIRSEHFTPEQTLSIVPKICEALQYAHEEGVLHRDIKPENILLDTRGRIKIADFGIASVARWTANGASAPNGDPLPLVADVGGKLTQAGQILGTPNYMAPEQIERPSEVDHRADIYSLGVVFYELLTGELPLGRFAPPSEKSDTSPNVDRIVLKALEKERERRQQSAGEMKTEIETAASVQAPAVKPENAPSGRLGYWGASLISFAMILFSVFLWMYTDSADRYRKAFHEASKETKGTQSYESHITQINETWDQMIQGAKDQRSRGELDWNEGKKELEHLRFLKRHNLDEYERGITKISMEKSKPARLYHEKLGEWLAIVIAVSVLLIILGSICGGRHLVRLRHQQIKSGLVPAVFASLIVLIPLIWALPVLTIYFPFAIRNWSRDMEFALTVIFAIANLLGIALVVYVLRILYRWFNAAPVAAPPKPVVEKVVVVKEPETTVEPPQEKAGLWRKIVAEVKTWPIWATILVGVAVICFGIPALVSIVVIAVGIIVFLFGDLFEAITGHYNFW